MPKLKATLFQFVCLRSLAAGVLLLSSVFSIVLALCGSSRALDLMKYHLSLGALTLLALILLSPVVLFAKDFGKKWPVHCLHLGLALALAGWIAGLVFSPAEGSLRLRAGQLGAVGEDFIIALDDFKPDYWPDTGTVRQYVSRARVSDSTSDASAKTLQAGGGDECRIKVNHPLVKNGWWVYQNSYETLTNPHTGKPLYFTVLLCVKDCGLPLAFSGGVLLILGALGYGLLRFKHVSADKKLLPAPAKIATPAKALYFIAGIGSVAMLIHRGISTGHAPMQNMYEFLMCMAAFMPLLTFMARKEPHALLVDAALQMLVLLPVAFFMDGSVKHLMPALQSPFFVPHVFSYVLGYLFLVRAAFGVGRQLVGAGFLLLTIGLVLGAAWGKVCWGHWWQFDPKEMWSLATWLTYAAYFHLRARGSEKTQNYFLIAGALMIVLTLTWINLSRLFTGMHSYA